MNSREEAISQARDKDHENLRTFINKSTTALNQKVDELEKKHSEMKEKIIALQDEKESLLRNAMSKEELLEYAKDCLKQRKAEANSILAEHLSACHKGHSVPFSEYQTKKLFAEAKAVRLLWLFLAEKDITKIISEFEELGIPRAEKDARILAIDTQINDLLQEIQAI